MKSAPRAREKAAMEGSEAFVLPKKKVNESFSKYVSRVYRANKDFFQKRPFYGRATDAESKRDYQSFKHEVESRGKTLGMGTESAILNTVRSDYMSGEQVARMNAIQGLKDSGNWRKFREMTKVKGRYTKFDMSQLSWSTQEGGYSYKIGDRKVFFGWIRTGKGSPTHFEMWENQRKEPRIFREPAVEQFDITKIF